MKKAKTKDWSVYVVRCKDDSLYTGISNDVSRRVEMHNKGKGAKYVKAGRRPVKLVYVETGFDMANAMKRERFIKKMEKSEKERLCAFEKDKKITKGKNMNDDIIFERKKERFECVRCGVCCSVPGYVFLNVKEAQKIAKHMKLGYAEFEAKHTRKFQNQMALKTPVVGGCIFWEDKKCTIYELRPSQCRTFPYWKELTEKHADWKEIEDYCEGAKKLIK